MRNVKTIYTITDTFSGETFTGDLMDACDWLHDNYLTDCPEECRQDMEDAVEAVCDMLHNANYNERRRVLDGKGEWLDGHSAPDAHAEREYLGVDVDWESELA